MRKQSGLASDPAMVSDECARIARLGIRSRRMPLAFGLWQRCETAGSTICKEMAGVESSMDAIRRRLEK